MRRTLVLAAALLAATATLARAELKMGDVPKDFGSDAVYLNCEDFDLVKMRGKVVVLQLAHTTSKPSQKQVKKLDELLSKYHEKGLHIVTAFEEPKDAVATFVTEKHVKYPVVAGVTDLRERWGLVKGFPTSYVLDVQGKVAWIGNFADLADGKIVVLLESVTDMPFVPERYTSIAEHLFAKQFVDARTEVKKALADEKVLVDDRERLVAVLIWLDAQATGALNAADAFREQGKLYDAYKAYLDIQTTHAGTPAAERAAAAVEALLADKNSKRELDAWIFFDEQFEAAKALEKEVAGTEAFEESMREVREELEKGNTSKARDLLKKLLKKSRRKVIGLLKKVISKYRGTAAAAKAEYWIGELEP